MLTSSPSLACRRSAGVNRDRPESFSSLSVMLVSVWTSEHKAYFSDLCIWPSESSFHSPSSLSRIVHKEMIPSGVPTIFPHVTRRPRSDSFRFGSDVFTLSMWCKSEYKVDIIGVNRVDINVGDGSVFEMSVISVYKELEPDESSEPD